MRGPRPEGFDTNPATPNAGQPTPMYPSCGRPKKGKGVMRSWLVLSSSGGQESLAESGKQTIMRTGISARDLRVLDPLLFYPSTVLGRERAIVINLEHIKAIITAQEVLLLNFNDPSVSPFIEELQRRILCHHHANKPQKEENSEGEPHTRTDPTQGEPRDQGSDEANKDAKQSLENQDGSKVLPFEFVALEACLEASCTSLESEAARLGLETYPALDKLTSNASTLNLERGRQIKRRLVAITQRVQKVRHELEHLLDNDKDMAEMYLTEKLAQKLESDTVEVDLPEEEDDDRNSRGTHSSSSTSCAMTKKFEVKELEMLLEPYFVQMDGTLSKLSTLREDVEDTYGYIKIMLNDRQNEILQMNVMLTAANLVLSAFIAVAGVFGMNITIELFKDEVAGPGRFLWTVVGGSVGCIFIYGGIVGWCKFKRLLG